MKNLFNNPWFIAALGICSVLLLGRSIVVPLLGSTDIADTGTEVEFFDDAFTADVAAVDQFSDDQFVDDGFVADRLLVSESDDRAPGVGANLVETLLGPESAGSGGAGRSVLNRQLTWNWHPRRDPFSVRSDQGADGGVPIGSQAPVPGGPPRLVALVAGPESLLAVLGDQVVTEGDRVGDYLVTSIQRDGVQVRTASGSIWIPLSPDR